MKFRILGLSKNRFELCDRIDRDTITNLRGKGRALAVLAKAHRGESVKSGSLVTMLAALLWP